MTKIDVKESQKTIAEMVVGNTYTCAFEIKNRGDIPLVISDIKSPCGCTVPTWDKQPVKKGKKTTVNVEIKPDTEGFFSKTITIYGNMENAPVRLAVVGNVKQL